MSETPNSSAGDSEPTVRFDPTAPPPPDPTAPPSDSEATRRIQPDPEPPSYSTPPSAPAAPSFGAPPPAAPSYGAPPTSGPPSPPPFSTPPAPPYSGPPAAPYSGPPASPYAPPSSGAPAQDGWAQQPGYPAVPSYEQPYGGQQQGYPGAPGFQQQPAGYGAAAAYPQFDAYGRPLSDKSKVVAGLLGILLGAFGAGRFYTGHTGIAVAQLLVGWFTCGLWGVIDGIIILVNGGTDAQGRILRD